MSFYAELLKYKDFQPADFFKSLTDEKIARAIYSESQNPERLLALLSPQAEKFLEPMALRARNITLRHFGSTVQLFTPMYLSNFCENQCAYCGFNARNPLKRKALTVEEVEKEAARIADTGLEHILILTGESRLRSSPAYIKECVNVLKKYFSSVCVEIYPLDEKEYVELVDAGVDGLTLFQETYDEAVYDRVHLGGAKKNYHYRLDAPERAACSNMRQVNLGALLGLNDWRKEAFWLGLHAKYLQNNYPSGEVGISLPRIRPHEGTFKDIVEVNDKNIAQILVAMRLFLNRLGVVISTRETADFRDNLLPLGVTRMSAGVSTRVGGHAIYLEENNSPQFEISDSRSVDEICAMLARKGYQPVLKDWTPLR